MDDFNNINANILLGAAISAGATERQTKEMSKKLQKASEASSVAYMELAAAIREQNYLSSLNEDERKEYFRQKQELEEKRRQEEEQRAKREAEQRAEEDMRKIVWSITLGLMIISVLAVVFVSVMH